MNIYLVGLVRDQAKSIQKNLEHLIGNLQHFGNVYVHIVESDSNDETLLELQDFAEKYPRFTYESCGDTSNLFPVRISRIRHCRNRYANFLSNVELTVDFTCVADLDGINRKLRPAAIRDCLSAIIPWDACFANQRFGYYDIYALRAINWCEEDIFEELARCRTQASWKLRESKIRTQVIYKKMRKIRESDEWIPVQSAFGGFGIYRGNPFKKYDYTHLQESNQNECEHVALHNKMVTSGLELFINPKLINSNINEHNIMRVKLIRKAIIKLVIFRQFLSGRE